MPWPIAKGFDTFLPLGNVPPASALHPSLSSASSSSDRAPNHSATHDGTAAALTHETASADLANVTIQLAVNGETRQNDSPSSMIFDIPRQLADISAVMTLEEGDLVLTGTPSGVGEVVPGDRIVAGLSVGGVPVHEASIEAVVADR